MILVSERILIRARQTHQIADIANNVINNGIITLRTAFDLFQSSFTLGLARRANDHIRAVNIRES